MKAVSRGDESEFSGVPSPHSRPRTHRQKAEGASPITEAFFAGAGAGSCFYAVRHNSYKTCLVSGLCFAVAKVAEENRFKAELNTGRLNPSKMLQTTSIFVRVLGFIGAFVGIKRRNPWMATVGVLTALFGNKISWPQKTKDIDKEGLAALQSRIVDSYGDYQVDDGLPETTDGLPTDPPSSKPVERSSSPVSDSKFAPQVFQGASGTSTSTFANVVSGALKIITSPAPQQQHHHHTTVVVIHDSESKTHGRRASSPPAQPVQHSYYQAPTSVPAAQPSSFMSDARREQFRPAVNFNILPTDTQHPGIPPDRYASKKSTVGRPREMNDEPTVQTGQGHQLPYELTTEGRPRAVSPVAEDHSHQGEAPDPYAPAGSTANRPRGFKDELSV